MLAVPVERFFRSPRVSLARFITILAVCALFRERCFDCWNGRVRQGQQQFHGRYAEDWRCDPRNGGADSWYADKPRLLSLWHRVSGHWCAVVTSVGACVCAPVLRPLITGQTTRTTRVTRGSGSSCVSPSWTRPTRCWESLTLKRGGRGCCPTTRSTKCSPFATSSQRSGLACVSRWDPAM